MADRLVIKQDTVNEILELADAPNDCSPSELKQRLDDIHNIMEELWILEDELDSDHYDFID